MVVVSASNSEPEPLSILRRVFLRIGIELIRRHDTATTVPTTVRRCGSMERTRWFKAIRKGHEAALVCLSASGAAIVPARTRVYIRVENEEA